MDIDVFERHDLPTVLRVLRTALEPTGALNAPERLFLETYARIAGTAVPVPMPAPIEPHQVPIATAHARKRLVQLSALAVLLSRPVKPAALAFLRALAQRLDAHDPVIEVIDALQRGRHLVVRLRSMRRVMRAVLADAWRSEGPQGVLRILGAAFLRLAVNKDRLWRFKRLGLLPEGTLGRAYWEHMVRTGFPFPGEPAGIAASVAYHDVGHVLTGHEATPLGEIQQGSFQAGNRREDGFFFVQFVVLHFHHGVRITPGAPAATGQFQPDRVLWAIHRGANCNVDITRQWDFWPLMGLPIDEARRRCALLPPLVAE
jgi:hypothetical protein